MIKEEKLPIPTKIRFLSPMAGVNKRRGTCIKKNVGENYNIIIYTTRVKWFPDPNGSYRDTETGEKFRKSSIGENIPYENIKKTLAHEIAHLKFWNHTTQHVSYTNYLLNKINEEL